MSISGFWKGGFIGQYRRLTAVGRWAVWIILLLQLPLLYLLINRLFPDFEIDGCYYHHMHMIERVKEGLPIYAPASTSHAGVSYTPLYWWISAAVAKVFGPAMIWARLVSLVFSILFTWIIGAFVWKNTEKNLILTLAAPAMVLTSNYNIDMVPWIVDINVNAVHVAFTILGFYLLRDHPSVKRTVFAAVAMSLGVIAKQTGLAYVVAASLLLLLTARKQSVVFIGTCAAILVVTFGILNSSSHGEFYRWTVDANKAPPWIAQRLFDEVLTKELIGLFGLMVVMALVPVFMSRSFGEFWRTVLTPEYVMCGSGVAVVCISQAKMGSGAIHALIAFAGLAVCGSLGICRLAKALPADWGARVTAWVSVLQLMITMVPGLGMYPFHLIDQFDREKYGQIASVFKSGRTCVFGYPFMSRVFGQPWSGYTGDEFTSWVNGQMDYSAKPDSLVAPFRNQEFDYVILPPNSDGEDPVVKAIVANYAPIGMLPRHPKGVRGGNMRYEYYVMRAKRLMPATADDAPAGQSPRNVNWRP